MFESRYFFLATILGALILSFSPGAFQDGCLRAQGTGGAGLRVWENREGRKLKASLSYVNEGKAHFELENGREAIVPVENLSDRDQAFIVTLSEQGLTKMIPKMPLETVIPKNIPVTERPNEEEGGVPVFLTDHFEFHNDSKVTTAFVKEASRVFEGTYAAVSALPLGLGIKTPDGMTHFKTNFQSDDSFREMLTGPNPLLTGPGPLMNTGNIAGVYIPKSKTVFVPYRQMGVRSSGSKMSLRKGSDTSTLVHEITHQLMHDWLPIMPLWMVEGLAEYVSAIPYQNGRFDFKNAERGFKNALEKRRVGREVSLLGAERFLSMKGGVESSDDYAIALVYVYYFMHLDRPDTPGAPLAAYIQFLNEGKENTQKLVTEHNAQADEYNKALKEYNARVDRYNENLKNFRAEVAAFKAYVKKYNERIRKHNELVNQGEDPKGKVEIGSEPVTPVPPKEPVVPDLLKNVVAQQNMEKEKSKGPKIMGFKINRIGGDAEPEVDPRFDVYAMANKRALPSLLRGRTPEQLEGDMKAAFKTIGLKVTFY